MNVLSILTRRDFLIGAAVGFFVGPWIVGQSRGLLDKVKGAAS